MTTETALLIGGPAGGTLVKVDGWPVVAYETSKIAPILFTAPEGVHYLRDTVEYEGIRIVVGIADGLSAEDRLSLLVQNLLSVNAQGAVVFTQPTVEPPAADGGE